MSRTLLILLLTFNISYGQAKADLKKLDSAAIKYYAATISAIKHADQKVRRDPINDALLRYTDSVNYLRYMQLIDSIGFLNDSYFANDKYASESQDILIIHYSIVHTIEMLRIVEKAIDNKTATINDLANVYTYYLTRMYQFADTTYPSILLIEPTSKYYDTYLAATARFITHLYRNGITYSAILPFKKSSELTKVDYNGLRVFYRRLFNHNISTAPLSEQCWHTCLISLHSLG